MKKIEQYWWQILLVGLLLIVGWKIIDIKWIINALRSALSILSPFIVGGVFAFFTVKPSKKLETLIQKRFKKVKKTMARGIGVTVVYAALLALLALILKFLIPAIYQNIQDLIINMPEYYKTVSGFIDSIDFLAEFNILNWLSDTVMSYMNADTVNKAVNIVGSVANSLMSLFLGFILSVYMLVERESLAELFKGFTKIVFKGRRASVIAIYARKTLGVFYSYFTGLIIDAVLIGAISSLFFLIFGAPYPWLLGLAIALGNMIPFFGPIVSAVIAYLACAVAMNPIYSLWVPAFLLLLGQIDGNIIQPKIIGTSVGMSPFWVIFAVTFFGGLWGAVGMIIGVPIVAALRLVYIDYADELISKNTAPQKE